MAASRSIPSLLARHIRAYITSAISSPNSCRASVLFLGLLDLRKAPLPSGQIRPATNCFSSINVAMATFLSDKTVFTCSDLPWKRAILCKSSISPVHMIQQPGETSPTSSVTLAKILSGYQYGFSYIYTQSSISACQYPRYFPFILLLSIY